MLYLTRRGRMLPCVSVCVMWCTDLSPLIGPDVMMYTFQVIILCSLVWGGGHSGGSTPLADPGKPKKTLELLNNLIKNHFKSFVKMPFISEWYFVLWRARWQDGALQPLLQAIRSLYIQSESRVHVLSTSSHMFPVRLLLVPDPVCDNRRQDLNAQLWWGWCSV